MLVTVLAVLITNIDYLFPLVTSINVSEIYPRNHYQFTPNSWAQTNLSRSNLIRTNLPHFHPHLHQTNLPYFHPKNQFTTKPRIYPEKKQNFNRGSTDRFLRDFLFFSMVLVRQNILMNLWFWISRKISFYNLFFLCEIRNSGSRFWLAERK